MQEGLEVGHLAFSALRRENNDRSPWVLEWIFETEPNTDILGDILSRTLESRSVPLCTTTRFSVEKIPDDIDWLEHSYKQFPAFNVGSFFIYGSHYEGNIPEDQLPLQIDAATAFGSGEHGTTSGCLLAMEDLKTTGVCPWNVLDMGTGSGILAIAAWKLWKTPILAVDNDPESIRVTERHLQANGVTQAPGAVSTLVNEGFAGDAVQKKGPFELITANILAGPLMDMAQDLCAALDANGFAILSGILNEQAQKVRAAYEAQGLVFVKEYEIGEWSTLVLQSCDNQRASDNM